MAELVQPRPRTVEPTWLQRPLFPTLQRVIVAQLDWEVVAYATLLTVGFVLRIWDVGARAMHHDESLHATYAWYLFKGRGYHYDPLMHGPLQFYIMALFYVLFGDNEVTARLFAVLCGTAIIVLPFFLRSYMGRTGALVASVFLTVSPAFLYFSRFARDDIYLAFFSLLLVVAMWGYLRTRQVRYIYIGAAAAALAMASMEAAYITFFIFGTFIGFMVLKEFLTGEDRRGYFTAAIASISLDTWLYAAAIFVVITVLLFSTFFTNPYGIWDSRYGLLNPNRQDILGGLLYWKTQHGVARGGQPWFYYLLLYGLYEQFAAVFGVVGAIWALLRRNAFTTFLLYWSAMALAIYSWAGEKMPWLLLHSLLPIALLAATFTGHLLTHLQRRSALVALATVLSLLFLMEVHSAQALTYADGANPTEMLIYVQTANDVPYVAHEVIQLTKRLPFNGVSPLIQVDNNDVQGWPFEWYFRNLPPNMVSYNSDFSHPIAPILIMLGPEYDQYSAQLAHQYVVSQYRWNWWFPEDYKGFTFDNGMCGTAAHEVPCKPGQMGTVFLRTGDSPMQTPAAINLFDAVRDGKTWLHLWNWFIFRKPFGARGARLLYLCVRRDLVPNGRLYPVQGTTGTPGPSGPIIPSTRYPSLSFQQVATIGHVGAGAGALLNPRGVAIGPNGDIYVADAGNHRIDIFDPHGRFIRSFGSSGTGPGQFNPSQSPMAVAVASSGDIYVADWWGHRIERFNAQGHFLSAWGHFGTTGPYGFYGPRAVAIGRYGRVYVADTGNKRIAVFSPNGHFLFSFGSGGTGNGQFNEPSSVAVAPNGDVYVTDMWNQRIQRFDANGRFLQLWNVAAWASQAYEEPYSAVTPNGTLVVTDPQNQRLLEFSADGRPLGAVADNRMALPIGVAVESNGLLVTSDAIGNRLVVLRLQPSRSNLRKR
jgi:uncharacterized protein (TIGR03663 family)